MTNATDTPTIGNITLELTHRCHRRCAFCYLPQLASPSADTSSELTAQQFVTAARTLMDASGCRRVQLSGGEPLLRKDLLQIVESLVADHADLSILTDGAHLDASLASALAARGVRAIQPTLLASTAAQHDALRGRGAFHDVTRAISVAAAAGLKVSVCMVITKRNYLEAAGVAELAFALGAHGLALSRFCPSGAAAAAFASLMPDPAHLRHAVRAAADVCRDLALPLAAAITIPRCVWDDPAHPPIRTGVCSLMGSHTTVTVGPDGTVRSCSLSSRSAGNVLTATWQQLSLQLQLELAPLRLAPPVACGDCPFLAQCLGGCRMAALGASGDRSGPDPLAPVAALRTR